MINNHVKGGNGMWENQEISQVETPHVAWDVVCNVSKYVSPKKCNRQKKHDVIIKRLYLYYNKSNVCVS